MYEATLEATWELFDSFLEGERSGLFCVISSRPLTQTARHALQSSCAALGYGKNACTFVTLTERLAAESRTNNNERHADSDTRDGLTLDAPSLFALVEGLDPICIVIADGDTTALMAKAYREAVAPDAASRLLGRTVVAFRSFTSMLEDEQNKQVAWALLKKLPPMKRA